MLAIPIELEFLDDGGMLFVATGTVTGRDLLEANATVYETREKTLASVYQVCDYRGVETVDVSIGDIRRLAERDMRAAAINPNIIIAVVGDTDHIYGLIRMWQAYTSEVPFVTRVFRTMDEARHWMAEQLESTS